MLRSLGQNPTDEELLELINSVDGSDGEKDGKIQLREFLILYASALGEDGEPAKAAAGKDDVDNVFMQFGGDRSVRSSTSSNHHPPTHRQQCRMYPRDHSDAPATAAWSHTYGTVVCTHCCLPEVPPCCRS